MVTQLIADYSLRAHNTFDFDVYARYAQVIASETQLSAALSAQRDAGLSRLVLGGGSNVVFTRDFDGLVWLIALRGRRLVREDKKAWFVEAAAGENWHAFVQWTLEQGWPGLENLALIPGTVGAAPIQNMGAYGLEISERFASLRAIELATGKAVILDTSACQFGYRESFFKQAGKGRFVIVAVTFRLPKIWQPLCAYRALADKLAARHILKPTPRDIFEAVVAIRRAKLPDPAYLGNVGSFFKHPIIDAMTFEALLASEPEMIAYRQPDGWVKLAAGWLIERCGWKGRTLGQAAVHSRQALVLVNHGGANGAQMLTLAQMIQRDVQARFGVWLETEPVIM